MLSVWGFVMTIKRNIIFCLFLVAQVYVCAMDERKYEANDFTWQTLAKEQKEYNNARELLWQQHLEEKKQAFQKIGEPVQYISNEERDRLEAKKIVFNHVGLLKPMRHEEAPKK